MAITDPNPNPLYGLNSNGQPNYVHRVKPSTDYGVESQLIRGTMSFSKEKLRELDPSYTGHTHIFVLRMPPFMEAIAQGRQLEGYEPNGVETARKHINNLKTLLELGSTSYSGTPDLVMNSSEVNTGWSERSYPAPTSSAYDGKNFTIRCLETRGEPLRRSVEYYISGVTDPNMKTATLHGALNMDASATNSLMEPTLPNITFSLMIVQTDQTLLGIQDISVWNSCTIQNIDRSNLDWENGNIDIIQPKDIAFTGVYLPDSENQYLYETASKLLGIRMRYYRRYRDMTGEDLAANSWKTDMSNYGA